MKFYFWLSHAGCFCDISSKSMTILILLCLRVYTSKICCGATFSKRKRNEVIQIVSTYSLNHLSDWKSNPIQLLPKYGIVSGLLCSSAWHNKKSFTSHSIEWTVLEIKLIFALAWYFHQIQYIFHLQSFISIQTMNYFILNVNNCAALLSEVDVTFLKAIKISWFFSR